MRNVKRFSTVRWRQERSPLVSSEWTLAHFISAGLKHACPFLHLALVLLHLQPLDTVSAVLLRHIGSLTVYDRLADKGFIHKFPFFWPHCFIAHSSVEINVFVSAVQHAWRCTHTFFMRSGILSKPELSEKLWHAWRWIALCLRACRMHTSLSIASYYSSVVNFSFYPPFLLSLLHLHSL